MHIKNKFLLIVLLAQPFTLMSTDFLEILKEMAQDNFSEDNQKKILTVAGTAALIYLGNRVYWEWHLSGIEYESKEIARDRAQNQLILELQKVKKDTNVEPEKLDTDKITERHLTKLWQKVDLKNKEQSYRKQLNQLISSNQTPPQSEQQPLEKLKKQNQEQTDSE